MTPPLYVSFFLHANLQYAEFPTAAIPQVVEQSYRPTCDLFLNHPWAKAVFEFSGYTLEILAADYPDVIDNLRTLLRNGQVELCDSTYANPILPLIPLDHAQRQIAEFQRIYNDLFGDLNIEPSGFYPQESAIDPSLIPLIRDMGYEWVPVMLNHYQTSHVGHLNIIPDLPLRANTNILRKSDIEVLHPFQIAGARDSNLVGIVNNALWIERLFQVSNGLLSADDLVSSLLTLHREEEASGPAFVMLGPSNMEFIGLEMRRLVPDWRWPLPIRPHDMAQLLQRLQAVPFIQFATAREFLVAHPPAGQPVYLKAGSAHPLLTPWTTDPDNERINALCREATERIRLVESLLTITQDEYARAAAKEVLEQAWRAMLLAENSDGRGWLPLPERRLFCYNQALKAIDLAKEALGKLAS